MARYLKDPSGWLLLHTLDDLQSKSVVRRDLCGSPAIKICNFCVKFSSNGEAVVADMLDSTDTWVTDVVS